MAAKRLQDKDRTSTDDFTKVIQKKNTTLADNRNNTKIIIPKDSVFTDTLIRIDNNISPQFSEKICNNYKIEKQDIIYTVSVMPHDSVYKRPFKISIRKPAGISEEDALHIQIFQFFENKKPNALKTVYLSSEQAFQADSILNGYFALIIDRKPPEFSIPPTFEFCEDRNYIRKIRLYALEDLSKINRESIQCIIDGEIYPSGYDDDRKWIEISLPGKIIANGLHHIFVKASDTANNEAVFRNMLFFN